MLQIGANFADLHGTNPSTSSSASRNSGLFFDALTERVCAVRTEVNESVFNAVSLSSNGKQNELLTFRTHERGRIRSIAFSPDLQMASIQQEDTVVDFLLLSNGKVSAEFRQICKLKGAIILGVHWLAERQICFVTDAGCELHTVNTAKRVLKPMKSVSICVNWFCYFAPAKLFIFASGVPNNVLSFASFQNSTLFNIGKLELDFGQSQAKPRLLERDITIGTIYGQVCLLALKFEASNGFVAGLNIFEFVEEQPQLPKLKCFIGLDLVGLVGVQVVDNLLLVHHKNAQKTLIFDTRIGTAKPLHSAPICMDQKLAEHLGTAAPTFLYNSAWKMSAAGYVIDMQNEVFTRVQLRELDKAVECIGELESKIQFLLNRTGSERVLLEFLQGVILRKELKFTKLTQLLRQILQDPTNNEESVPPNKPQGKWKLSGFTQFTLLTCSHNSILNGLFEPLHRQQGMDKRQLANLMVDFFLLLKQRRIQIQNHYMAELLLKIVADAKMWTCLQQLLQYRVIEDSKFLAFELISLSEQCPALYQIALDMLNRRGNTEQIAEVLLARGYILEALRFIGSADEWGAESPRLDKLCLKLIGAAWLKNDRPLMFTVFTHLQAIGRLQGLTESGNEDFIRFSREFELLYGEQELEIAEERFRLARLSSIRGRRDSHRNDSFTSSAGDANDLLGREIQADTGSSTATDGSGSSSLTGN